MNSKSICSRCALFVSILASPIVYSQFGVWALVERELLCSFKQSEYSKKRD